MRRKNTTSEMLMDYIVQALLLIMKEKPYQNISISEITKKAGVNRSTYYRHFEKKESIVQFYLDSTMQEYQDAFRKNPCSNFRIYMLTMFETFYSRKEGILLIHDAGLSFLLLDVLNDHFHFETIAKKSSKAQQFKASYHIGGIYNNLLLWFSHRMNETPAEMTQIALSYRPENSFTLFNMGEI